MLEQTYLRWLGKEVSAAKYALLVALEKKDNLLSFHKKFWNQRAKANHTKLIDSKTN